MAGITDPMGTIVTWLKASVLPSGARLTAMDADYIDDLGANSGGKIDGEWFWRVASMNPNQDDLNTYRSAFTVELSGVWSTSGDAKQISRIARVVLGVARRLESAPIPEGMDIVQITESVPWEDRFGLTIVAIPFGFQCEIEVD